MKRITRMLLALALPALLAGVPSASAQAPDYSNVQLVSIDPMTRIVVIKNAHGASETLQLDDAVAVEGLRPGDQVILAVRNEPGRNRISSIRKSGPAPQVASRKTTTTRTTVTTTRTSPATTTRTAPVKTAPPSTVSAEEARQAQLASTAFSEQVAGFAQQARTVDNLWRDLSTTCKATVSARYESGRDWFGIWDDNLKADLSIGNCRETYNQILVAGEVLKQGMAGAEDAARRYLLPGQMRDIKRAYSLDWDGWGRPAPDKVTP